jgi:hypothetical protein
MHQNVSAVRAEELALARIYIYVHMYVCVRARVRNTHRHTHTDTNAPKSTYDIQHLKGNIQAIIGLLSGLA